MRGGKLTEDHLDVIVGKCAELAGKRLKSNGLTMDARSRRSGASERPTSPTPAPRSTPWSARFAEAAGRLRLRLQVAHSRARRVPRAPTASSWIGKISEGGRCSATCPVRRVLLTVVADRVYHGRVFSADEPRLEFGWKNSTTVPLIQIRPTAASGQEANVLAAAPADVS